MFFLVSSMFPLKNNFFPMLMTSPIHFLQSESPSHISWIWIWICLRTTIACKNHNPGSKTHSTVQHLSWFSCAKLPLSFHGIGIWKDSRTGSWRKCGFKQGTECWGASKATEREQSSVLAQSGKDYSSLLFQPELNKISNWLWNSRVVLL